jgi:hypothetical protein
MRRHIPTPARRATACLLALLAACAGDAPPRSVPEADDRLARTYIRTLHDSGAVAVMGRTKRESAAVPAFAFGIEAMRALLPRGPIDTVHLERFEPLRDSTHAAAGSKLTYGVRGGGQAAEVEVWVEREGGRPVVDQLRVSRRQR